MARYPTLRELKKSLGEDYTIEELDGMNCLYRDCGNGYYIKIGGLTNPNRNGYATAYLWYKDRMMNYVLVKAYNTGRSVSQIKAAADKLYELSESLAKSGYNTRTKVLEYAATHGI